jgi:hypothetical protein
MATNRPTIDSQGYKSREGLIIEAACDMSLKKEFALAVWNMNSSLAVRHGRSSGVVCASFGEMKNQNKLLVHVM